jgi:(p)ppGpp synthase/HD superfamily hydrolase
MDHVDIARTIAYLAHRYQEDKTGRPYFGHLERVAKKVDHLTWLGSVQKAEAVRVAYLHDFLEDNPGLTLAWLQNIFPIRVLNAIVAITKIQEEDYFKYIDRVSQNFLATVVKLQDLEDNMSPERWCFGLRNETDWMWVRYSKAKDILSKALDGNNFKE